MRVLDPLCGSPSARKLEMYCAEKEGSVKFRSLSERILVSNLGYIVILCAIRLKKAERFEEQIHS